MITPDQEQTNLNRLLAGMGGMILLIILILSLFFCCISCQYLPHFMDDVEKIADNDAVTIKCDKDCFNPRGTDLDISISIKNKDK